MTEEQSGGKPPSLPPDPNRESSPLLEQRLQRISHYLRKRLERVGVGEQSDIVSGLAQGIKPPTEHHTWGDFVEGVLAQPVPKGKVEPHYDSVWMTNVCEETLRLLALSSPFSQLSSLAGELETQCEFNDFQMNRWINSITESQVNQMERIIGESNLPLKYSWTEQELLHEIFLATGKKVESLDAVTTARFDADATKGKHDKSSSLSGDFRLLKLFVSDPQQDQYRHYLQVHIEEDPERGVGSKRYRLGYVNYSSSPEDALEKFKYTVDYCSGKGASQEIQYLKVE